MKEGPILLNGEMVRATLAGRKTNTRRVIKPQTFPPGFHECFVENNRHYMIANNKGNENYSDKTQLFIDCPYGQAGDRLWVRETWGYPDSNLSPGWDADYVSYRADEQTWWKNCSPPYSGSNCSGYIPPKKWRPSIFMPRWASRITLEIVKIRVERLLDITAEDAKAEGVTIGENQSAIFYLHEFKKLWNSINAARGYSWEVNPYVWVIQFRKVGK